VRGGFATQIASELQFLWGSPHHVTFELAMKLFSETFLNPDETFYIWILNKNTHMKKLFTVLSFFLLSTVLFTSCTKEDVVTPQSEIKSSSTCSGKRTTSVQCIGTTQSGSRCKNKTLSCNERCYLHGGN
jgi:hypothetical protein